MKILFSLCKIQRQETRESKEAKTANRDGQKQITHSLLIIKSVNGSDWRGSMVVGSELYTQ